MLENWKELSMDDLEKVNGGAMSINDAAALWFSLSAEKQMAIKNCTTAEELSALAASLNIVLDASDISMIMMYKDMFPVSGT